jgi:signal peptidase
LQHCPAPYDGFITKGDANPQYDQVSGIAAPVQERDIAGVARVRVPYLGYVRLGFATATRADVAGGPAIEQSRSSPFTTIVSSRNGGVCSLAASSNSGPAATRATGSLGAMAAA